MDCPACGTEYVERSGGENLTVFECPSCQRLPLWRVGLLAVAGILKHYAALAGSLPHVVLATTKRLATRTVAALARRPQS